MKVMKILWLCNIVLPDFSQEFKIKKNVVGGWLTGMLHELEKREGIDIDLCFPIYDEVRLKDGNCHGHNYYTFLCDKSAENYNIDMIGTFERILEKTEPDIVHIWGTEYPHTMAMLLACQNKGMLDRAVVNIQGLVSVCARHYFGDIPREYQILKNGNGTSIEEDKNLFEKRGKCEIESLKLAHHVIGRTDWDRACVEAINPQIQYHFCDEILREAFYKHMGSWKYGECQKHSIFVSQAFYPVKGFHYLLQALPIIIQKYPDVHVYVAGTDIFNTEEKGGYTHYLEKLMEQFGLEQHVSFVGRLGEEQMIQQYLRANVFVSASTIENSSNSINEAMLIGVPSVVSFVGGTYNRMCSGEDGFLYPYDEPALLAYYVCKVFENENDLCEKISKSAFNRMQELIDPKRNGNKNMQIYREIIENQRKKID